MNIDQIVRLVEQVVDDDTGECEGRFFSYRHAAEIHALGLKHEFAPDSPWSQVCISVVVSAALTPKIWVRILWSRAKAEYPTEECVSREFALSDAGVRAFAAEWPNIRKQLALAVARGLPP